MNRLRMIFRRLFLADNFGGKINVLFNRKTHFSWSHLAVLIMLFSVPVMVKAEQFSANFKGTDIHEFINTISKNLGKTIIIDPPVKGKITVRSYEQLDEKQYYQFFLNVLDVYGYTVISMPNNVLKVLSDKSGKRAALSKSGEAIAEGDEVVMRVVPLQYVSAKDISVVAH
ncbi:MAG: Type II secretion system protein D [Candidatus Erwinia impunctatus]|nr:Type II secretion system protein D [Culicoides impunctatus]